MSLSNSTYEIDCADGRLTLRLLPAYEPGLHGIAWSHAVAEALHPGIHQVVLDFSESDRLDSRIYTGLIQVQRACTTFQIHQPTLFNPGPRLLRGLDLLRITPLFQIERCKCPA